MNAKLIEFTAWISQNAFNLFIQSTALILLGLLAARVASRYGSAVQSAIYRATLVAVLACPIAAIAIDQLGFDGWTIPLPETTRTVMVAETEPPVFESSVAPSPARDNDLAPNRANPTSDDSIESFVEQQFASVQNQMAGRQQPISNSLAVPNATTPSLPTPLSTPSMSDSTSEKLVERVLPNFGWVAVYAFAGLIWLIGVFVLLVRLAWSYRKLNLLRQLSPHAETFEQLMCSKLADQLNVTTPEVRRNSLLSSPCLTGITSPSILLPSEITEPLPLEKAFAHELAHVRRRDNVWNLIQRMALALFFFQPLMWRLVYRLEATAEEVCDDFVVRHCMDRTGYAEQLVALAESNLLAPNMAGLGMFKSSESALGRRVVRILDTTRKLTTQLSWPAIIAVVVLTVLGATVGGFLGNDGNPFATGPEEITATTEADLEKAADPDSTSPTDENQLNFSGRVIDATGSPVAGATVRLVPRYFRTYDEQTAPVYATATSNSEGQFHLKVARSNLYADAAMKAHDNYQLVAFAPGHGFNWVEFEQLQKLLMSESGGKHSLFNDVQMKLTKDTTKTKLRLIDPEGNVIRNATAKITSVTRWPNEDMSAFIEASKGAPEISQGPAITESIRLPGLHPIFKTDEDGFLEVMGVGDNRIMELDITGPSIAIRQVRVATAANAKTSSATYGGMYQRTLTTYAPDAAITCEPTQPIIGRVVDRETGKPLPNVLVMSSKFAGTNLGGINILKTRSDADGRFRLVGMPKGPGNTIIAVPDETIPYFMTRFEVPSGASLEPVSMDIPLQRGVFVRGKVTNAKTGNPVAATFYYFPFLDNDVASNSPVYEEGQFMEIQSRYTTKADGSFQVVGLPGRGVIGLNTWTESFPSGMGWEKFDAADKASDPIGSLKTFRRPFSPSKIWPTAMQLVEISDDQVEQKIDFVLDPGLSIPLKIVDQHGQPLTGASAIRLQGSRDYSRELSDSDVSATGFAQDEQRLIKFNHYDKKLSRVIKLDASAASATTKPMKVQLLPDSIMVGKLVDGNGDPIRNAEIRLGVGGGGHFSMMIHGSTKEDGSFQINHVPSGTHYSVSASAPQTFYSVNSKVDVGPGEQIDFGTVTMGSEKSNEFSRTKLQAEHEQESSSESASKDETLSLSGKVVDSDGRPVADARVYVKNHQVQSAKDGTFELAVPESATQPKKGTPVLFALKDGYGRGFCQIKPNATGDLELKLPEDSLPIKGTLMDPEGNPIAGAQIKVEYISTVEDIDQFLSAVQEPNASYHGLSVKRTNYLDDRFEPVTSDSQGRFQLNGIGKNRVVSLRISGESIRLANPVIVTAKIKPISLRAYPGMMAGQPAMTTIHGHQPNIVCGPTQVINGMVVDSETGQPLKHVPIVTETFADVSIGNARDIRTKTDDQGRFQLVGMPVGEGNVITAHPVRTGDNAIPYLPVDFVVPNPDRPGPVDITIKLQRGVFVRGTITDKATGAPVAGTRVTYKPYQDNEMAQKVYPSMMPEGEDDWLTGPDGKFQFVALPGEAIVGFWTVQNSHYPPGQGWESIPAARKSADGMIEAYGYTFNRSHPTAMKQLRVDTSDDVNEFNIQLDSGKSVSVKMIDPDGKPVSNVRVNQARSNIDRRYLAEQSQFEATGFLAGQKRTLIFHHEERDLGAIQSIGFDDETVTVQLQPHSKVTGRLIDGNNDPLAGRIRVDLLKSESFFLQILTTLNSDKDGRFEFTAPPGDYGVFVESPDGFFQLTRSFTVEANQPFDFGTVDIEKRTREIRQAVRAENAAKKAKELEDSQKKSNDEASHSVSGTVVDAEGQPVAGATIEVDHVYQPEDTTEYLRAAAHPDMTIKGLPPSKKIDRDSFPTVTANAQGQFTIDGIEPGQIAVLKIVGDNIALTWTRIANAETQRLTILRMAGMFSEQYGKITILGNNNPTVVCEATQIITGVVVDRETGDPLPGVAVVSDRFANLPYSGVDDLEAITDEDGRFRLSGMPAGHTNGISAFPPIAKNTKSYLARDVVVEPGSGGKPVDIRIELQRGVLVNGKVVDKISGQPIANAEVNYKPYRSNKLASKLYSEDWIPSRKRIRTASDGSFQLVALPGKGLVDVLTNRESPYPPGQGWRDIPVGEKNHNGSVFVFGRVANRLHPTAMKEIEVANVDQAKMEMQLELDPGKTVPVHFVDSKGKPVSGVEVIYAHSSFRADRHTVPGSQVELSFAKGQKRTVAFYHPEKNLGAVKKIRHSDDSVTVKLLPNTTVSAKLVDTKGDPLVNAKLRFDMQNGVGSVQSLPFTTYTDVNGEFEQPVLPGMYRVYVEAPPADFFMLDYNMQVLSGRPINMGTVDAKARMDEEMARINKRVVASKGREWNNTEPITEEVEFKGIVVDLYDKPVAGATVSRGDIKATTGKDGSFSIKLPKSEVDQFANGQPYIVVEKNGYGPNFAPISSTVPDQTVLLPNDDHPIEGQLIDPEGNPVAGAEIKVGRYQKYAPGVLDSYLKKAHEKNQPIKSLPQGQGGSLSQLEPVTSDANGKFTIRGIGSGRVAFLQITGASAAFRTAIVGTTDQPAVQFEDNHAGFLSDGVIHGRKPVLTCEPSQPIEGIVVDRDTGKPLVGFSVTSYGFLNDGPSKMVGQTDLKTTTDNEGRFVLHGMPKGKGNSIIATAPTTGKYAQPFITQAADVPDARGLDAIEMKVEMQRGVWIGGKVVEQETGKPIVGAGVQYMPLNENEAALKIDRMNQHFIMDLYGTRTDKQGRYRFVGVPGPAIVAPWIVNGSKYPAGQGYEAVESIMKQASQLGGSRFRAPSRQSNAFKQVDIPAAGEEDLIFKISSGNSIRVKVVDDNGSPQNGVTVSYMPSYVQNHIRHETSEFQLDGFLPNKKKTVVFMDAEKQQGAIRVLDGSSDSIEVQLQPLATVQAKLVDDEGHSVAGVSLRFNRIRQDRGIYQGAQPVVLGRSLSDKEGNFTQQLIPGDYVYSIPRMRTGSGEKEISLSAGQTLNLGTININKRLAEPKFYMAPSNRLPPKKEATEDKKETESKKIGGVIRDQAGKPIAGAQVRFNVWNYQESNPRTLGQVASSEDGRYTLAIDKALFEKHVPPEFSKIHASIVVRAENFAAESVHWSTVTVDEDDGSAEVNFELLPDRKIVGRLVDLEGKAVAGAKVYVTYAKRLGEESVEQFIQRLNTTKSYSDAFDYLQEEDFPHVNSVSGAIGPWVESNANGEFSIEGIAAESLVDIRIEHSNHVTQLAEVITRAMKTVDADSTYRVHGDRPTLLLQPSRPVVGKIVDSKTGQPISGAMVYCSELGIKHTVYGSSPAPRAWSDKTGEFRLLGIPKSQGLRLMVYPPTDQPYLVKEVGEVPDTAGLQPASMTIKLHRGIWISGQVTDLQTGNGVQGEIVYLPMKDNPNLVDVEGYQTGYSLDRYQFFGTRDTDRDGNFRIVGLPGKAVLGAVVRNQNYRAASGYEKLLKEFGSPYSEKEIEENLEYGWDLRGKKYLNTHFDSRRYVYKNVWGSSYIGVDATVESDSNVSAGHILQMDAGKALPLKVVDTNGQLVGRFNISNVDGFSKRKDFTHGIAELQKMGEDEVRRIWIRSTLGAMATIAEVPGNLTKPSSLEELHSITLKPYATVSGRLIDKDGKPIAKAMVDVSPGGKVKTGKDGNFEIKDVIADQEVQLEIVKPGADEQRVFLPKKKSEAGKVIELGDINVDAIETYYISGLAG